ncbi:MAG: RES family NAD+ phosphorylase [Rhodocyclaceae bacterium]|nr:RES family NAD+ phosphorylase [Rhodocyclaceae bacterium]
MIATRFPSKHLFEGVAKQDDWDNLERLANITSPRIQQSESGWGMFKPDECATGAGASLIMAPFAYLNPDGSRFTDGTYGAYYAGRDLKTAVDETVYHAEKFARDSRLPAITFEKQVLEARIAGTFHDLRQAVPDKKILSKESYAVSQPFARKLHEHEHSNGIVYPSVRSAGGECVAVFLPRLVTDCRRARYLAYVWDGKAITQVYEMSALHAFKPKAGKATAKR